MTLLADLRAVAKQVIPIAGQTVTFEVQAAAPVYSPTTGGVTVSTTTTTVDAVVGTLTGAELQDWQSAAGSSLVTEGELIKVTVAAAAITFTPVVGMSLKIGTKRYEVAALRQHPPAGDTVAWTLLAKRSDDG